MLHGVLYLEPAEAAGGAAVVLVQRVGAQLKVTLMAAAAVPIKWRGKGGIEKPKKVVITAIEGEGREKNWQ